VFFVDKPDEGLSGDRLMVNNHGNLTKDRASPARLKIPYLFTSKEKNGDSNIFILLSKIGVAAVP
jgi:hypothetical protein